MNDFTKEELIELLELLEHGFGCNVRSSGIPRKIQFMIDNYSECKHTLTMTDTLVKCQDCKKVIEYDE